MNIIRLSPQLIGHWIANIPFNIHVDDFIRLVRLTVWCTRLFWLMTMLICTFAITVCMYIFKDPTSDPYIMLRVSTVIICIWAWVSHLFLHLQKQQRVICNSNKIKNHKLVVETFIREQEKLLVLSRQYCPDLWQIIKDGNAPSFDAANACCVETLKKLLEQRSESDMNIGLYRQACRLEEDSRNLCDLLQLFGLTSLKHRADVEKLQGKVLAGD